MTLLIAGCSAPGTPSDKLTQTISGKTYDVSTSGATCKATKSGNAYTGIEFQTPGSLSWSQVSVTSGILVQGTIGTVTLPATITVFVPQVSIPAAGQAQVTFSDHDPTATPPIKKGANIVSGQLTVTSVDSTHLRFTINAQTVGGDFPADVNALGQYVGAPNGSLSGAFTCEIQAPPPTPPR